MNRITAIRGHFTLIAKSPFEGYRSSVLTVPSICGRSATVSIDFKSTLVEVQVDGLNLEATNGSQADVDGLAKDCRLALASAVRQVLGVIKYLHRAYWIDENLCSSRGATWQIDGGNYIAIPTAISVSGHSESISNWTDGEPRVTSALLEGIVPLEGLRFLHKARLDLRPSYMWIDTTTAAELAVKEALIRKSPQLEALLLEMPSPPIGKLYGSILEHYLGARSPVLKHLVKGAETRNKLVHRPGAAQIELSEASEYLHRTEAAIFHLMSLLYPASDLIKYEYKHCLLFCGN